MTNYVFPMPAGANPGDCVFAGVSGGTIPAPDGYALDVSTSYTTPNLVLTYLTGTLTPAQQTAFAAVVQSNPAPANAPWRQSVADLGRLAGVPAVLRNQATTAAGTTVTSGNAVAVLQTVVNDLGIFCARLADLIEGLGLG